MRVARWVAVAVALALAMAVSACAVIPASGPVQEGQANVLPVQPFEPILQPPDPAADPAGIVTGFLSASAGGVATDFSVARQFLTDDAAGSWDPGRGVSIYDSGAVTPVWDPASRTVAYEVPLASTLDDSGRRIDAAPDEAVRLEFTMEQQDGEWRISGLADGILVSQANFTRFFRPVELIFATPDLTTAVPELRWLPGNNIATSAARELIEGPSPWLADAVVTGFPATAALAVESVVVTDGVASVDLTAMSAGSVEERALAQEQLRLTLTALTDVTDVEARISGLPLADELTHALAAAPLPDSDAIALTDSRVALWDGTELWRVGGSSGALPEGAQGLAVSYDGAYAAYVVPGEGIQAIDLRDGGARDLLSPDEPVDDDASAPIPATTLVEGDELIAPSFDRYDYVWSASANEPSGLIVTGVGLESSQIPVSWLEARTVVSVAVSRDGSRLAVLTRTGGQTLVEVAAIVRDSAGAPLGIGPAEAVGPGIGPAADLAWVDSLTIGALGESDEAGVVLLYLAGVGGGAETISVAQQAVALTARAGRTSMLVVSADGTVQERLGTSWATVLEDVDEIAYGG